MLLLAGPDWNNNSVSTRLVYEGDPAEEDGPVPGFMYFTLGQNLIPSKCVALKVPVFGSVYNSSL